MKFCVSCSKELDDNIAFCPACGTKQEIPAQEAAPMYTPVPAPKKDNGGLTTLFSFIGDLLAIVSAFFMALSIGLAELDINVYYSSYSNSINSYGYMEPNGCSVIGFLLSLGVIGLGVVSLIFSLKNHEGTKGLFKSIKKLTLGTVLAILGIVFMACM